MPTVAPTKTKSGKFVGERVRRVEDPRLMTGAAAYVDDIRRPELLHIAVVRSPYAAAKINSIDTSKAAALPGVQAVYTGKDVVNVGAVPCAGSMPSLRVPLRSKSSPRTASSSSATPSPPSSPPTATPPRTPPN